MLGDPEEAAGQALSLARGAVAASDGTVLTLWVDTLCIHGDSPGAVAIATAVRRVLADSGIEVLAPAPCMTRSVPVGEVRPFGDRALLIGVDDPRGRARRWRRRSSRRCVGADVELVCGLATVGVVTRDPDAALGAAARPSSATSSPRRPAPAPDAGAAPPGRLVTIPCAFDGPDLAEVAGARRPLDATRSWRC